MTSRARVHLRPLLVFVVLTTLGAFGLLAGTLAYDSWNDQVRIVDQQNTELARAISLAVDQEVEHSITALQVMASLTLLDAPDVDAIDETARRLVPRQLGWHGVLLVDAHGGTLLDTASHLPRAATSVPSAWAEEVIRTGLPLVSNLVRDPGVPGEFFIVAVPVVRGGEVREVLGAKIRRDRLSAVLTRYEIPEGGVVALLDRDRLILARTRNEAAYVGKRPSPDFYDMAGRTDHGTWRSTLLERVPAYAAMYRSASTGWTIGLGMPKELLDARMRGNLLKLAGVGLLVLAAGGWSVIVLARGIVPALDTATVAATSLARGETLPALRSRIAEVAHLFGGLREAEATLAAQRRDRDEAERGRQRAAQQREEALRSEQAARREAEAANRLKDEFLMAVSHELRTPLTAIRGWARMLATGEIQEAQRARAIETIDRNAHALTQLVNDLIDVSQSASGKLRLELRLVPMLDVVRAAVDAVQPAALARSISLEVASGGDGALVLGDPDRLQQVVWNVVANAVKFTPGGGRVDVKIESSPGNVQVLVTDNGPGIDPAFLPYVFDQFRQGSAGGIRTYGGLGLGLAIVRHLTEMHGGTVTATNNDGAPGATFRILLPSPSESPLSAAASS